MFNHWCVWLGVDELRAIHVGYDTGNTEISVSLLTDREPQLADMGCEPFDEARGDWPVGDWRLNGVNKTWTHGFPDCAPLLDWMSAVAQGDSARSEAEQDADLEDVDLVVGEGLALAFQHAEVLRFLRLFKRCAQPLPVRVSHFDQAQATFMLPV